MSNSKNIEKTVNIIGFLLAQKLQEKAPKRTGMLARSFPATVEVKKSMAGYNITFKPMIYFKHVEFGTTRMIANPFFRRVLYQDFHNIVKTAFNQGFK